MYKFGIKMPLKIIFFAKHQKHILVGSSFKNPDPVFLDHPDPDPDKPGPWIRIQKNWTRSATIIYTLYVSIYLYL